MYIINVNVYSISTNLCMCVQMASFASLGSVADVSEKPNQLLDFAFPKHQFGKTKVINCSFQAQWFQEFRWLHYDQFHNLAFCHNRVHAVQSGKMKSVAENVDLEFISCWFAPSGEKSKFNTHEHSKCHKSAEGLVIMPRTTMDIGEMLLSTYSEQKKANREHLLEVIQNVWFLARQGLPLRGDGKEEDSNFVQLLFL